MKTKLLLLVVFFGLLSCEKATIVQYNDSFCGDSYVAKFNVSGSALLDGTNFPFNRFNTTITDSTSIAHLTYREENKFETTFSLLDIPLNDTLFSKPDSSLTFLRAGISQCDVIFTCFWQDGPEASNWVLLSTVDSVHYKLEAHSMLYSFSSSENCELFNGLKDTIKTEINIEFEAL